MQERLWAIQDADVGPGEKDLEQLSLQKQQLMVDQGRAYLEELFRENSSLPVRVKNVQVTNSQSFRRGFLERQLQPLMEPVTSLGSFLAGIDKASWNLQQHGVIEQLMVGLHELPKRMWSKNPHTADLVPVFNVVPQKRFFAKTGTSVGNGEGDGYIQVQIKNVFGGAESLVFDAITGTKTLSSYLLSYSQPVLNLPLFSWNTQVFSNTRKLEWIQSSVTSKGLSSRLCTNFSRFNAELAVETQWRALLNHGSRSSLVMRQAGDSTKTAVLASAWYDTRDSPVAPQTGGLARLGLEWALPISGTEFVKVAVDGQTARRISENHSLVISAKSGVLFGQAPLLDKFYAGGPNDVRSFALHGLGPKDQNLSIGGDLFLNGGISLFSHIPKTPKDTGFRWHNYLNWGRLVEANGLLLVKKLAFPLVSFGTGLVYNHPQARFELNFGLPVVAHGEDFMRKGIQYGVGVSFL